MRDFVYMAGNILYVVVKSFCPVRTGNLVTNGITMKSDGSEIYIGGDLAPYAIYTNENWNMFAPPLQGHTNPHERWIDKAIAEAVPLIKSALSGNITEEEYNNILKKYNKQVQNTMNSIAEKSRLKAEEILKSAWRDL